MRKRKTHNLGSECGRFASKSIAIEVEAIYNTRAHTDKAYSNRSCSRGDKPCWRGADTSATSVNEHCTFVNWTARGMSLTDATSP